MTDDGLLVVGSDRVRVSRKTQEDAMTDDGLLVVGSDRVRVSRKTQEDTMTVRLHIDWTACDGRGLCAELLPETLGSDPWGYPVPRDGTKEPVVPPALAEHARRAVRLCPALALRLRTVPEGPDGGGGLS
ncbi:ferredoxin [Amycolatopsis cynarae]|uniref:Ferredoxin n=1 Tax=Amycolatopsis cynarae TaxID=2995223 RepID=A0ABY7AWL7_9PSEU|nr:ferredoxin [Amycolatopsis sp. HUAS 11-8]WAL64109.1 ferredoxin [Amycolatopsis sp. HUAS 11-8]